MNYRIFVEKKSQFQVEANCLLSELNTNLQLKISELRLINVYDLFGFSEELLQKSRYRVFGEIATDFVTENLDLEGKKYLAIEFLPGQFDQRADSAVDCVKLLDPAADIRIKSSKLLIFDDEILPFEIEKVKKYLINSVECREKDLQKLTDTEQVDVKPIKKMVGFRSLQPNELNDYCKKLGLAMNSADLQCVIDYFRAENREPIETELRILDTYWSDHCRHTTFSTVLDEIKIDKSFIQNELQDSLALYKKMRSELKRDDKEVCLMDLATIGARYLRSKGFLDDLEVSDENNACSLFVNVDVDGETEKWLLQFKNETHNHPTEIEPFGGAATCLGGAIRDPLSGRSYVYQAMRVTGAADIYSPVNQTLEGKLPQRIISTKAAHGYSSYGNQIGLATTHVREIYHEDYLAKRLEVGAVVGAVKAENVRREKPTAGDIVLLLGGKTGRDGIGGATGSSKEHNQQSLETCSSEVQKGNAPEERKLQRLFRRAEVTRLIKKSNDFGAGGVSVAIGELADGLDIYLDRVPTKYAGLNATELAISESQERMAVVVEAKNREEFENYCAQENIEVVHVADITDTQRMRMFYKNEKVADLSRAFIDSAGAKRHTKVKIAAVEPKNPFERTISGKNLTEKMVANLSDNNVVSQKGLVEMFDSTIGATTVLMPFGGKTQFSETQVSVQKLPVLNGKTNTASMMAFGYNPFLTAWSPYHGAAYAVVEACAKVVAAGGRFDKMRFSYQEYFERMHSEELWGKPLTALLGALKMQESLKLPSIGGKDSMSGTFQNINVPPMLMAFGITTVDARNVIGTEFKKSGNFLYLIRHEADKNFMPNCVQLTENFNFVSQKIEQKIVQSAYAIGFGGVSEAIAKMAFGNEIGAEIAISEADLFNYNYGSILVESTEKLDFQQAEFLGKTTENKQLTINGEAMALEQLLQANTEKFCSVYPNKGENGEVRAVDFVQKTNYLPPKVAKNEKPIAYLPVFPGTNCDYDTAKAFRQAGAEVTTSVFCNLTSDAIFRSISEMKKRISECQIFVLSGGFSAGDEPDGSGKFICNVLQNVEIDAEIQALIDRGGLILGICNGFQALVKSGLLPYGRLGSVSENSPTLFRNNINRHVSQMVTTRVSSVNSPWLAGFCLGEQHTVAMSHGEGKFVVSNELAKELFANGQIAFQYVDLQGNTTQKSPFNPNGSDFAIEGILSKNGQILGKMGHSERYGDDLFKNIVGNKQQAIFQNAVNYFKNGK